MTSVRPEDSERLFEVNLGGVHTVLGECLRADVGRVILTSSAAALGPAKRGGLADEDQLFTAGHLGIPYVNSVHEAESEAFRLAARGLPLVCVNPSVAFGPGDVHVTSTRLVRSLPPRARARLRGRRPQRGRRARRGHRPPPGRRPREAGRALHPRRAQLHLRPALRRPRAPERGGAPAEGAAHPGGGRGEHGQDRAGAHDPDPPGGPGGQPVLDLPLDQGQARAGLERPPARGDARGHGRVVLRARARPDRALAPLPGPAVQGGGGGDLGVRGRRCRSPAAWRAESASGGDDAG